eukprot:365884-Chlamydomonas_euryale.AAC.7
MGGNELLTLQLGGYANYVGTHYWNIQRGSDPQGGEIAAQIQGGWALGTGTSQPPTHQTNHLIVRQTCGTSPCTALCKIRHGDGLSQRGCPVCHRMRSSRREADQDWARDATRLAVEEYARGGRYTITPKS